MARTLRSYVAQGTRDDGGILMLVAFIRPAAPAVGHLIVDGTRVSNPGLPDPEGGYIENALALCGYSTEKAGVDVAVVIGNRISDVDCKKCLRRHYWGTPR